MSTGLRERRKQETRQAISDVATEMFVARGFDEVTIAQVADAAGVAKMTVTNYFPRKEDLVFDRAEGVVRSLAGVFATRAPGESLLAAIRRDYAERIARSDPTLGLSSPAFARMVGSSPVLASRGLEMLYQRERALGDAIAAETGADDPQQRIVAATGRRCTPCCTRRQPGAASRVSGAMRSARHSPRRPPARSTCSSRRWAGISSGRSRSRRRRPVAVGGSGNGPGWPGGDPRADLAHPLGRVVRHLPAGLQPPGAARVGPRRDRGRGGCRVAWRGLAVRHDVEVRPRPRAPPARPASPGRPAAPGSRPSR